MSIIKSGMYEYTPLDRTALLDIPSKYILNMKVYIFWDNTNRWRQAVLKYIGDNKIQVLIAGNQYFNCLKWQDVYTRKQIGASK